MSFYNLTADNTLILSNSGLAAISAATISGVPVNITKAKLGYDSITEGQTTATSWTGPTAAKTVATLTTGISVHAINDHLLRVRLIFGAANAYTHVGNISFFAGNTLVGYFVYQTAWSKIAASDPLTLEFIVERDYSAAAVQRTDKTLPSVASASNLPPVSLFNGNTAYVLYPDSIRSRPPMSVWTVYFMKGEAWVPLDMALATPPVPPSAISTVSPYYADDAAPYHDGSKGYAALSRSAYGAQVRATFGIGKGTGAGYLYSDGNEIVPKALPAATEYTAGTVRLATTSEAINKSRNDVALTPAGLGAVLALLTDVKVTSLNYSALTGILTVGQNDGSTFDITISDVEAGTTSAPNLFNTLGVTPTLIYGGNTSRLGTPTVWLSVNGYKIPAY